MLLGCSGCLFLGQKGWSQFKAEETGSPSLTHAASTLAGSPRVMPLRSTLASNAHPSPGGGHSSFLPMAGITKINHNRMI